jgi:hypothetical protein
MPNTLKRYGRIRPGACLAPRHASCVLLEYPTILNAERMPHERVAHAHR